VLVEAAKRELEYTEWEKKPRLVPSYITEAAEIFGDGRNSCADYGSILQTLLVA
jgi:hypothetical protein